MLSKNRMNDYNKKNIFHCSFGQLTIVFKEITKISTYQQGFLMWLNLLKIDDFQLLVNEFAFLFCF